MKKIWISLVAAVLSLLTVAAQKVVYDDNVQKRNISAFHAIETSSGIEVIINKGDREELESKSICGSQ